MLEVAVSARSKKKITKKIARSEKTKQKTNKQTIKKPRTFATAGKLLEISLVPFTRTYLEELNLKANGREILCSDLLVGKSKVLLRTKRFESFPFGKIK